MQPNTSPLSAEQEIIVFYAFQRKILQAVSPPALRKFIDEFFDYLQEENPNLVTLIQQKKELTPEIKAGLDTEYAKFFKMLKEQEDKIPGTK